MFRWSLGVGVRVEDVVSRGRVLVGDGEARSACLVVSRPLLSIVSTSGPVTCYGVYFICQYVVGTSGLHVPVAVCVFMEDNSVSYLQVGVMEELGDVHYMSARRASVMRSLDFKVEAKGVRCRVVYGLQFGIEISFGAIDEITCVNVILRLDAYQEYRYPRVVGYRHIAFVRPIFCVRCQEMINGFLVCVKPREIVQRADFVFEIIGVCIRSRHVINFLSR